MIVEPVPSAMPSSAMDISVDRTDAFTHGLCGVIDIDAKDHDNPQLVSEYVNDIYEYMRVLEVGTCTICCEIFFMIQRLL